MPYGQTIAIARGLLAEGRAADVARMLDPLVGPANGAFNPAADPGRIVLHCLMARTRILRFGDPSQALQLLAPFDASAARAALAPAQRAEVALWLGWAHAWQGTGAPDPARALNLLSEAERLFSDQLDAGGRCWALLGQAMAYASIDEYPLMQRALADAEALPTRGDDRLAAAWIHDMRAAESTLLGHAVLAQHHIDALLRFAQEHHDPHLLGRGRALEAALAYELGRAPESIVATATEAVHLLTRSAVCPGQPLVAAVDAQLGALFRQGAWAEAHRLIPSFQEAAAGLATLHATLDLHRAQLDVHRGQMDEARARLEDLLARVRRQSRLLTARVALLTATLYQRRHEPGRAAEWTDRALQLAREAGHTGYQVRALLARASADIDQGRLAAARTSLQEAELHAAHFSLLPLAAPRFLALGRLAAAEGHAGDARAYLSQAISAFSLIGDAYHVGRVQLEQARLSRQTDPAHGRAMLDAALKTFASLKATPDEAEARSVARRWPAPARSVTAAGDRSVGAALAQASVSVDLVAEAWLQAFEGLLPSCWMAVYRHAEEGHWQLVHAHGPTPEHVTFPDPTADRWQNDGVVWLRLRRPPGPAFFFAAAMPDADPSWTAALEAMRPWLPVATLALDHALLRSERLDLAPTDDAVPDEPRLEGFVHASPAMRALTRQIHRIRASHSPVLITGESGTGKELIARAVHALSERAAAPFVAFNCSTVPHELFDSHLFGHEKGAFTGASRPHPGVIRAADGGTLFLDEIGDLPLDVQPKLLRFLQEGEVFPLGARRPLQVNVRVIAATNRNLESLIQAGQFREDLYYRLNVVPLRVPPLRERKEEIPLLVRHFLSQMQPSGAPLVSITNRALDALLRYDWPGNVRQLRNEIERALVFVRSEPAPLIDLKDLSDVVAGTAPEPPATRPSAAGALPDACLDEALAETERQVIEQVLARHGGRIAAAASMLGLTRQGLYKKMKRLGIESSAFRPASHTA